MTSSNITFLRHALKELGEKHDECLELANYSKELKKLDDEFYKSFYAIMKEINTLATEV